MTPRPDIALCSVSAKSCTHHAHCLRAQLPPHPTRQCWTTPNRRGDECALFVPVIAYTLAESENLGRTVTANEANTSARKGDTGAAARETAGGSGSASTYTPAGSEAVTETRPLAEAGGGEFGAGRSSESANTTSTGHAAGSAHAPTSITSSVTHDAGVGADTGATAGAGPSSAPVRLTLNGYEREQLQAARVLGELGPYGCRCQTLAQRVVGDGCDICNPTRAADLSEDPA